MVGGCLVAPSKRNDVALKLKLSELDLIYLYSYRGKREARCRVYVAELPQIE
jgi:hypothetical protein